VEKLIKELEGLIKGYELAKDSDVVERNSGFEYMEGYVDGLNQALSVVLDNQ